MKKTEPIVEHGLLIDRTNYKGLIEAQANERTFLGKPKKVVAVKSKRKGKSLTKTRFSARNK